MKVLDVNEFQQGLERNLTRLTRLENEMKQIETAIQGLTDLEDSLKGQGGEALRGFYENCHLPFLQFFNTFKSSFTTILQTMDSALTSLEPDEFGYICQEALEGEIELGLDVAKQVTEELTNETNQIMNEVSDIVSLPNLDDSEVQTGVLDAKSHRDQTVVQLNTFDLTQTMALATIQQDLLLMKTWITNIESMMLEGVTDVNFPAEQWKAFAFQNPLMTTLAARTLSMDSVMGTNPLLAPGFISGANSYPLSSLQLNDQLPLTNFGIEGATVSTNFVSFMKKREEEIAKELSCPPTDVENLEAAENGILDFLGDVGNSVIHSVEKSVDSFNEIGEDFWAGLENRNNKKFNSVYDFGNYLTLGSFDGVKSVYQGLDERADVAFESPTNFANYLTLGSVDLVKGAVNPKESFSKEHWLNSLGLATIAVSGVKPVVGNVSNQVVKNGSTKQPSSVDEVVHVGSGKTGVGKTGEGIPIEKVKPSVLKQIYADDNGAYGYLPNEGTAYNKPEYDFTNVEWSKEMQNVRKEYLEASKQLENDIEKMKSEGFSKENIAKHVVEERNQQKIEARENMTPEERSGLEERNIKKYGNPIGPTSESMFNKMKDSYIDKGIYKSDDQIWEAIIQKSMQKDDVINTLLGLEH
nr:LXG domain-containing protein [Lysinibacillus timonensis]